MITYKRGSDGLHRRVQWCSAQEGMTTSFKRECNYGLRMEGIMVVVDTRGCGSNNEEELGTHEGDKRACTREARECA